MSESLSFRVANFGYWDVQDGKAVASVRILPVDHLGWVNGDERSIVVGNDVARRLMASLRSGEIVTLDGAEWEEA